MGFYSSIDCQEVYGTRRENTSIEGGIQASVQLKVVASLKDALLFDLLSNQRDWPNMLVINPPRAYSASSSPFSSNSPVEGQSYRYDHYLVDVQYTTDPDKTLFSESIEPTAEFVRLDYRFFRWSSGAPLTEGEAPGILRRELKLVKKYYNKMFVPAETITKPGSVHNAPYTSPLLGLTFPAETLMYAPDPVDRTVLTSGTAGFNFTNSFHYKPNGWNKYWRPQTQSWESIYLADGTEYKSYPPEDLSAVLV